MLSKDLRRARRKRSVRAKVSGDGSRPRLSVFRSNVHIYGSLVDDTVGKTLMAVGDKDIKSAKNQTKTQLASAVGKLLAEKAAKKNIKKVVFDRNGYLYHGRVKALAQGAREGGLEF